MKNIKRTKKITSLVLSIAILTCAVSPSAVQAGVFDKVIPVLASVTGVGLLFKNFKKSVKLVYFGAKVFGAKVFGKLSWATKKFSVPALVATGLGLAGLFVLWKYVFKKNKQELPFNKVKRPKNLEKRKDESFEEYTKRLLKINEEMMKKAKRLVKEFEEMRKSRICNSVEYKSFEKRRRSVLKTLEEIMKKAKRLEKKFNGEVKSLIDDLEDEAGSKVEQELEGYVKLANKVKSYKNEDGIFSEFDFSE